MRLTPEIIAAMHELALEQRRELGVRAPWHVGDVTWGLYQHEGREDHWKIRIWREEDRPVAWSWLKRDHPGALLDFDIRRDRIDLLDEILADPDARTTVAFEDDDEVRAALEGNGFTEDDEAEVTRQGHVMRFLARDLPDAPEPPPLPEGFRYRTVEPEDFAERVAIHRDVWAPSRVTEASFANVQSSWPYRASLDCVVEAPDGRFAAYALMWPDDENRVGELEPVGVREEFRRRGLGAAVCIFALRRLHEEGGRQAIVYCVSDEACALYESIGFRRHATLVGYSRSSSLSNADSNADASLPST